MDTTTADGATNIESAHCQQQKQQSQQEEGHFLVALLDLPKYSRVGLDGQVIVLQTDDFVGIQNVPSQNGGFHLVTACAAAAASSGGAPSNISSSVTVGFVVVTTTNVAAAPDGNTKQQQQLIRRYSPRTEEVAEEAVDDVTIQNLLHQISNNLIAPSRLLSYEQVVVGVGIGTSSSSTWEEQIRYINQSNILELRGLGNGDKIVAGSYDPEDDDKGIPTATTTMMTTTSNSTSPTTTDGKSLVYPPIPVINTKLSLATHKHAGTRRFLAKLAPEQRTKLFVLDGEDLQQYLLDVVLRDYYQGSWEALLGDLQLSFCLFLYLYCLSSLEHWKDLVAMLSLATTTSSGHNNRRRQQQQYTLLYQGLLQILPYQLSSMDAGFLEDMEEASGNFLLPSLEMLQQHLCTTTKAKHYEDAIINKFRLVLVNKFPQTFTESSFRIQLLPNGALHDDEMDDMDSDDDNEDGPVMVDAAEIRASLMRSAAATRTTTQHTPLNHFLTKQNIRQTYPLLVAAIQPHEDILMVCARALDEQTDVGLVREAAAYLEEVEQYNIIS